MVRRMESRPVERRCMRLKFQSSLEVRLMQDDIGINSANVDIRGRDWNEAKRKIPNEPIRTWATWRKGLTLKVIREL